MYAGGLHLTVLICVSPHTALGSTVKYGRENRNPVSNKKPRVGIQGYLVFSTSEVWFLYDCNSKSLVQNPH